MFEEIAYSIILGKSVIFWTGTLAFFTLISGAAIAFFKKPERKYNALFLDH